LASLYEDTKKIKGKRSKRIPSADLTVSDTQRINLSESEIDNLPAGHFDSYVVWIGVNEIIAMKINILYYLSYLHTKFLKCYSLC